MPCVVTQEEKEYYEREDNKEKFGVPELTARINTTVACEMGALIKRLGKLDELSPMAQKWLELHEAEDRKRDHKPTD